MGLTVRVFDMAPTILKLYGIPLLTQMRGHVLSEIFEAPGSRPQSGTKNTSTQARLLFRLNRLGRNHVFSADLRGWLSMLKTNNFRRA